MESTDPYVGRSVSQMPGLVSVQSVGLSISSSLLTKEATKPSFTRLDGNVESVIQCKKAKTYGMADTQEALQADHQGRSSYV